MNTYRNIKIAFSYFPAFTEESPIDQKNDFKQSKNTQWINFDELKQEIKRAANDSNFSWRTIAKEEDFIHYAEEMTEKEVFIEFQLLTWDIIFDKEVLQKEDIKKLQDCLLEQLSPTVALEFEQLIATINTLNLFPKKIDELELLRAYYENNGYQKIHLNHVNGSEKWFYNSKI